MLYFATSDYFVLTENFFCTIRGLGSSVFALNNKQKKVRGFQTRVHFLWLCFLVINNMSNFHQIWGAFLRSFFLDLSVYLQFTNISSTRGTPLNSSKKHNFKLSLENQSIITTFLKATKTNFAHYIQWRSRKQTKRQL